MVRPSTQTGQIRPAAVNGYVLTTVGGATVWAPAAAGGTCGPLSGDTDSTKCGNNNFVGTPVTQGSTVVQAYGFTNANSSPFLNESIAIGNNNLTHDVGTNSSADNLSAAVGIGLSNSDYINTGDTIVGIGQANAQGAFPGGSTSVFEVVGIGDGNAFNIGNNVSDVVAIGDAAADTIASDSSDIVAIGDGALKQCPTFSGCSSIPNPVTLTDVIAIGDTAASFNQGSDVVAIGPQALGSNTVGAGVGVYNQGNEIVAIGHETLVANTTGTKNVAIGGLAGANGYTGGTTFGNSNKTGSNNTWIGYGTGPNTTSQLSNTTALGFQAVNTASNQVVLGNSSVTQTVINGTPLLPHIATGGISCLQMDAAGNMTGTGSSCGGSGGSGTVTNFTAGTLSPLFTTSVATSTTTPALTFALSNAAANTLFGNFTGTSAGPTFGAVPSCSGASNALTWTSGTGFGCNTISGGGAVSSVSNSDGTLTISPTTGAVVASLALSHANIWTALQTFSSGINLSGSSSVIDLGGSAGSAGQCLVSSGSGVTPSWGACTSGIPTATAPGQIIASTAAGTTYAVQGQVFYSTSGDTISSIETECSSLCTYVVTIPQTFTLASSHALNSNVNVQFDAGGLWTVNGAFTLTLNGNITGTLNQHFAGSSTIAGLTGAIPVEWFGAIGYTSISSAISGTDSTTAIQATINSITSGGWAQLQSLSYKASTGITVTTNSVGIRGTQLRDGYPGTTPASNIVNTSATVNTLSVHGSAAGSPIVFNVFKDFGLIRSTLPTGTVPTQSVGFYSQYTGGEIIDGVTSNDSLDGFYFNGTYGYGTGHFNFDVCNNGLTIVNTYSSGTINCVDVDSTNGTPMNSAYFFNVTAAVFATAASNMTSRGFYIHGTKVNDVNFDHSETASMSYGLYLDYTGTGSPILTPTFTSIRQPSIIVQLPASIFTTLLWLALVRSHCKMATSQRPPVARSLSISRAAMESSSPTINVLGLREPATLVSTLPVPHRTWWWGIISSASRLEWPSMGHLW